MSRFISAAVIAVFLAVVCIASSSYASSFADEITEMTEEIYNGEGSTQELEKEWERYSEAAALYFDHKELEEVTALIGALDEVQLTDEGQFKRCCVEIKLAMEHLEESQMPKLNNIF